MKNTKLTRNFPLKIMSVLIGFLIWFIVVNVDNPVSTKSITIAGDKVELQNTAYVDSANMMCMQDDDPDPIRVTITGERRLLTKITQTCSRQAAWIQIRLWFPLRLPVRESVLTTLR